MLRTYSELIKLPDFKSRFDYLKLSGGIVGKETFGSDRWINQLFYSSSEWKTIRRTVILRDSGCDLGLPGFDIYGRVIIHHMNPVSQEDILAHTELLIDPEYLICVSIDTHNALHYGDDRLLVRSIPERKKNDTCPWKR